MNIKIKLLLLIIICIPLCGCWNSRELNALSIVAGIGIDKSEQPGNILLTNQIVKPGEIKKPSKGSSESGGKPYFNIQSSSNTVFDAIREFTHETGNKLYISHTQVLIIGRDIASEGMHKNLDFFMRSHETRPTTYILISDKTASEILESNSEIEKVPAMNIAKLAKADSFTSHALSVNLQEFTSRLLSKTTSPIAPIISLKEKGNNKITHVEGMAVFKKDKFVGTLDEVESRGLIFVLGKIKSGSIVINFEDGNATLEIIKSKTNITPEIENDKITFFIKIKIDSNLAEQTCPDNLATLSGFSLLEKNQSEVVKNEILSAFKKAKELNTDIFGFGDLIHKKYKNKWKKLEDNWDKIFPNINYEIEIESNVRAAGLITKPLVPESETEEKK